MSFYKAEDVILFEDNQMIVCHKRSGLAVQSAGIGTMDLESILKNYLSGKAVRSEGNAIPYLAVIHRLDQPVEGLVVFAKTPQAAKELSRQIRSGLMQKEYRAVVRPVHAEYPVVGEKKELINYLRKDAKTNRSAIAEQKTPDAKRASLTYEVEAVNVSGEVLLHIALETGRHHQIRVQLSHAGLPIVGDRKYAAEIVSSNPIALCAVKLAFYDPKTKKERSFSIRPQNPAFAGFYDTFVNS